MDTKKKRKKGAITPMVPPPEKAVPTGQAQPFAQPPVLDSMPMSEMVPPPPDTNGPIFQDSNPSLTKTLFKSILFCIPTAILAMGAILFYAQNQMVKVIPEIKTVYRTLGIVQPYASFKSTDNTPHPSQPLIGHITQLALNDRDNNHRLYGIIYNTTANAHYKSVTLVLEFLTDNNTPIATQTHMVKKTFTPSTYTAFELPLRQVPVYATRVRIKSVQ